MSRKPPIKGWGEAIGASQPLESKKAIGEQVPPPAVRHYLLADGAALPLLAWRSSPDLAGRMPIVRTANPPSPRLVWQTREIVVV